jgi:hypothetical protein
MTVFNSNKILLTLVPAAAVIQGNLVLFVVTEYKGCVACFCLNIIKF